MNKLLLLALFVPSLCFASDPVCSEQVGKEEVDEQTEITTAVPSHLKGATIIVRLADGKETTVPAERFKVVPRVQEFVVTKTSVTKVTSCTTNDPRKNRVSLLGGHGAKAGLDTSTTGSTVEVESRTGVVGGAQYQRMLGERLSIGGQLQTNKTGSVLLGLDF